MNTLSMDTCLKETFGFETFRPGQREIIETLLNRQSALAVFPTGAGKSLCYQLPALMVDGMTLVVSPLIALMKDQIDFLHSKGVAAARLDSSLSGEETRQVWDDLWNGKLKVLYVAPERFNSERFLQRIKKSRIGLMVIDEAHCISEWGHNFRPDYLKLAALSRDLGAERVLALTATATPTVARDIQRGFAITSDAYVNTGFHRPNLTMRARACRTEERDRILTQHLKEKPAGATIVYVTLQKTAEDVAEKLAGQGLPARAYHAGMEPDVRNLVQDWFMASPDAIVVATIAFGMGIDKPDIRYVYHYNLPKSLENYMQETGRAGRDGAPSICDLLVCPDDIATLENFTYGDTPTGEAVTALTTHLLSQPDRFDVSVYELSGTFDIRALVVNTLLTYLETEGILASTGPFYDEYKFQPTRPSSEILVGFDENRTKFLTALFTQAKKGRTWYTLNLTEVAEQLDEPRDRLVAAMNYLEDKGDVTLKVAGVRRGYRFLRRPENPKALADLLIERFLAAETRDIARIQQIVDLATMPECTVRHVLAYFGENLDADCGHCDRCLGEPPPAMPTPRNQTVGEEERQVIRALFDEGREALATPRQVTRFLCGLPSPLASKQKLTKDPRFGCYGHLRFKQILEAAEALR